jgi:hypothetical protein
MVQAPYVQAGYNILGPLAQAAMAPRAGQPYLDQAQGYLQQAAGMVPPSMAGGLTPNLQAWLQQTPGYQFQLGQGLSAVQGAAAARGLGVSGTSLKGAATYATGLADANYQNQFNNAQTAWQDVINQGVQSQNLGTLANTLQASQYGQLANIANLGQNAATGTAQAATAAGQQGTGAITQFGSNYGNFLTQAGQAQAAGTVGPANALTSSINNYLGLNAFQNAIQNSMQGSTTLNPLYG